MEAWMEAGTSPRLFHPPWTQPSANDGVYVRALLFKYTCNAIFREIRIHLLNLFLSLCYLLLRAPVEYSRSVGVKAPCHGCLDRWLRWWKELSFDMFFLWNYLFVHFWFFLFRIDEAFGGLFNVEQWLSWRSMQKKMKSRMIPFCHSIRWNKGIRWKLHIHNRERCGFQVVLINLLKESSI